MLVLLYFSAIAGVLCQGHIRAPDDGARRLQAAAGAKAEAATPAAPPVVAKTEAVSKNDDKKVKDKDTDQEHSKKVQNTT